MDAEPTVGRHGAAPSITFDELVLQHQGFLRAWLRRLTRGDVHLADDLAQDTFLRALAGLSGFRGGSQVRTWLARIALNVWHDHLRREGGADAAALVRRSVDGHDHEGRAPADGPSADDTMAPVPDHAPPVADTVTRRIDIDRALATLPDAERLVVIHACWGDLSQAEIAEATGLPLGTVKTLHRRAMARLARSLGEPL